MEKIYSLLWILLAIGVFIFRMVKKMQETTERERQERPNQSASPAPALPQVTFQEMLKQMQQRNTGAPAGEHTPAGRPVPQEKARPALSQEHKQARPKSLESTKQRQKSLEAKKVEPVYATALPRASTEAPITDYWEDRERRHMKEHAHAATVTPLNQSVRLLLTQPESFRAAFVLSEILQRRHF